MSENIKLHLFNIDKISEFLSKNSQINVQYSEMFNEYFPYVKNPFIKDISELNEIEKEFREKMINSLFKNENNEIMFDMKKYYYCLKDMLHSHNIFNLYVLFLINKNELIGSATLSTHLNKTDMMLTDVCIREKFQRKGYGKIIIKLIIDFGKKIGLKSTYNNILLTVDKKNIIAQKCYISNGFKIINNNYKGEFLMQKKLY